MSVSTEDPGCSIHSPTPARHWARRCGSPGGTLALRHAWKAGRSQAANNSSSTLASLREFIKKHQKHTLMLEDWIITVKLGFVKFLNRLVTLQGQVGTTENLQRIRHPYLGQCKWTYLLAVSWKRPWLSTGGSAAGRENGVTGRSSKIKFTHVRQFVKWLGRIFFNLCNKGTWNIMQVFLFTNQVKIIFCGTTDVNKRNYLTIDSIILTT